jgi:hypothetical protein
MANLNIAASPRQGALAQPNYTSTVSRKICCKNRIQK